MCDWVPHFPLLSMSLCSWYPQICITWRMSAPSIYIGPGAPEDQAGEGEGHRRGHGAHAHHLPHRGNTPEYFCILNLF